MSLFYRNPSSCNLLLLSEGRRKYRRERATRAFSEFRKQAFDGPDQHSGFNCLDGPDILHDVTSTRIPKHWSPHLSLPATSRKQN